MTTPIEAAQRAEQVANTLAREIKTTTGDMNPAQIVTHLRSAILGHVWTLNAIVSYALDRPADTWSAARDQGIAVERLLNQAIAAMDQLHKAVTDAQDAPTQDGAGA